jgi:glycosyltransferase involved in cell wall biosynthesis
MRTDDRLNLLILSESVDRHGTSEPYVAFKWVEALGQAHNVTLLTQDLHLRRPAAPQLPHVRVVSWEEPALLARVQTIRGMVKPGWPLLARHARRWIREELAQGRRFDLAHQITPIALRHASPFRHFDMPYVIGPVGGMLSTPASFAPETRSRNPIMCLRHLDRLRLRLDPALRSSFERASAVIGVGAYVDDVLKDLRLQRFVVELEAAAAAPKTRRKRSIGQELRLLHVGRAVRTKGLRDVIRSLAHLRDCPHITLTSAGGGEDLNACRAEAKRLGVSDRVRFLGHLPRGQIDELYATHDLFVFPSFREPTGFVLFEAMQWGLPIITANRGGPAAIFAHGGAELIAVTTPQQYPIDIAGAIRRLATSEELLAKAAAASTRRYLELGSWSDKVSRLTSLYHQILEWSARATPGARSWPGRSSSSSDD